MRTCGYLLIASQVSRATSRDLPVAVASVSKGLPLAAFAPSGVERVERLALVWPELEHRESFTPGAKAPRRRACPVARLLIQSAWLPTPLALVSRPSRGATGRDGAGGEKAQIGRRERRDPLHLVLIVKLAGLILSMPSLIRAGLKQKTLDVPLDVLGDAERRAHIPERLASTVVFLPVRISSAGK